MGTDTIVPDIGVAGKLNWSNKIGEIQSIIGSQRLTRRILTHFKSFEQTQNVSIFGEGLALLKKTDYWSFT